jgi:hypothetical protein
LPRDPPVPVAGAVPIVPIVPPGAATPGSPYVNWADRMQRTRGRHAAITRNLYTWSSYKNWTEKVKDTWQEDPTDKEPGKKPSR